VAQRSQLKIDKPLIDPKFPWKVTLRNWNWSYTYKTTPSEWQSLLTRAKNGDPQAEWEVADRYADGSKDRREKTLVKRSAAKAASWFRRSAERGSTSAQNRLGVLLGDEKGTRKNVKEALLWLKKAFRGGDQSAAHNIAVTYRENGDLKNAVQWFRKAVRVGDGEAQLQLGIHYYWGKGVRPNPKAAVRHFRAATKSKNISASATDDAFFFLAIAYQEGRGVKPSIPIAKRFFKQANADGDHAPAAAMLKKLAS
jgi:uncharacterized protein